MEAVTLIAQLAGEVIVVDEVSLIKEGLVRVKLRARAISKLKGFVEFFVEGTGYEVKFTPENSIQKRGPGKSPPPPRNPNDESQGDEDDDLFDTDEESQYGRNARGKYKDNTKSGERKGGLQANNSLTKKENAKMRLPSCKEQTAEQKYFLTILSWTKHLLTLRLYL